MNGLLDIMLGVAVPMWIHEIRHWSPQRRAEAADRCTDLTTAADVVLEPSRKEAVTTAKTFNAVAQGLACLAYTPGGVTFLGMHWCVYPHEDCQHTPPTAAPAPPRRIRTLATIGDVL